MFAVNGQTGKVAGNLPISVPKFILFYLLFFLLIGGALFGIFFAIIQEVLVPLIVGIVIGLISATAILLAMRRTNKAVRFQYGAANYVRDNSFHISVRKDIFLYRRVTKTRRSTSSSSSRR